MAITQIGSGPEVLSPGYSPVWFYFTSTNKNNAGFRYVVDLYDATPVVPVLIHRYRIAPRPGDGYCEFNVSKVLSTYLTNQVLVDLMGADPTNCYFEYELKIGEEYSTSWAYTDFEFYSNPGNPFDAYVKLRKFSPDVAHPFIVGDQITVAQTDLTPQWPVINGYHTVVAVPDIYTIVIDLPWWQIGSGPTAGGSVTYANNTKTLDPNLLTVSDLIVFNGAMSWELYRNYDANTSFGLTTALLGSAITNCPKLFSVRPTTRMGFNWYNNYSTLQNYIYAKNSAGTIKRVDIGDNTTPLNYTAVGPATLNSTVTTYVSGPAGNLITDDITSYEIWSANSAGTRISEIYKFVINRRCTNYREYEVGFTDRLGSFGSFSFIYRNEEVMEVQRQEHKFMLGDLTDNTQWNYSTTDAGSRITNVDVTNSVTMRTAWLSDAESVYFQELISSPVIWLAHSGGEFYPVICNVNTQNIDRHPVTKNIKYTATFRMANNEIINW